MRRIFFQMTGYQWQLANVCDTRSPRPFVTVGASRRFAFSDSCNARLETSFTVIFDTTQPFNDEPIRCVDLKLFSISEMAKLSVILATGCWTYTTEALSVSIDFVAFLGPIFLARIPRVVIDSHLSSHNIYAYRSL